jgi:hypothetical protein
MKRVATDKCGMNQNNEDQLAIRMNMKMNMKRIVPQRGLARAASLYPIALTLIFLGLPGMLRAQTLLHRYSFVSDASDSVGTANGTIVAPTTGGAATISGGLNLPGNAGGGFGISGYVSLPSGILTNTSSVTVECWLTQNQGNGWAEAWDFGIDGSHNFALIPDPDNNNHNMSVAVTPHGNEIDVQSETAFPSGAEQYVVVTFNNSTLMGDLYTNGVLEASQQYPDATYTPGSIGGAGGTTENMLGNDVYGDAQFDGTIYEFRIWNGVVSQRYLSASALLGPSVVVTNLTPTTISVTAPTNVVITGTVQATATVEIGQTGTNDLLATSDATWTSGNTNILTVNSSGLISGVGAGTTTVTAKLGGFSATSGSITVTPQTLVNRYSFVSDATDSVSGANGTLVAPNGGAPATIDNGLMLPGNTVNGGGSGYSGYVSLPNGLLLGTSSLTVECWVTQNQGNTWAELWDFGNSGSQNFGLIPDSGSGNTRVAFTPNGDEIDIDSSPLQSGSEQYVVVTYDNSTLIGSLYTNGILDAAQSYPNIVPSYAPGTIGGAGGTTENMLGNDVYGDYQFGGTIYEFRIWNGAVSPLYVAVSAAAGSSAVVTNLTPSLVTVTVTNTSMVGAQTQQATVSANLPQASGVTVTTAATNWTSSNPTVLSVSSSGLITGISGGNATVSATVGGVTATSASITVALTAPVITQQPSSSILVVGQSATFTVGAVGGDLTYQWSEGVTPIEGATNATLTLPDVTLGQAGNYSVLVTNALGSTNSVLAALTVDTAILEHRYSFVSDASDSVGGSAWNGTIVPPGNTSGGAATINNGLNLPGGPSGGYSGYVSLPNGIVAGDTSVTVECWVQPTAVNTWAEIWDFGSSGSVNFALIQDSPGPGNMRVAFTPNGGEVDIMAPTYLPVSTTTNYIVVTYDNFTLTGDLYTNAVLDGTVVLPNASYSPGGYGGPGGTTDNAFGNDVYGDPQFGGNIYEVRIWNGLVSPLYIAVSSVAGPSVLVTNLTPLSISVMVASTNMTGESTQQAAVIGNFADASSVPVTGAATNWTSSATNVLTVSSSGLITAVGGGSATISATVGGIIGTSTSITVPLAAPTITQEPAGTAAILAGGTLHTSVGNAGLEPYTYYWYFDTSAQPIGGATAATLTIPNVQAANAGSYTCVVSNAYGSVTSTPTVLTVVAPTPFQANLLQLGPLAYWPLDETGGTIAYDEAGGYNGSYLGGVSLAQPGVTNAEFGSPSYSALFDGVSGYVDIPEGPFNITGAISIAAWVNVPATPAFGDIIGHGDPSWRMAINGSAGEPGANDGNLGSADATSSTSIVDGNWHLLVYTYTGDLVQANNGSLYVDGALVAHDSITKTPTGDNLDVWIGGAPDYGLTYPNARLFSGYIAHAAVFTHALSAAEVGSLITGQANMGITLSGTSAVITWPSGVLLQAPTLNGPWTTNNAAVSPYTVPATNGTQFYKTVSP